MADQQTVRRIALTLPGALEEEGRFAFSVENKGKRKGFAWVWLERLDPRKPRVPRPDVLAVRVRDQAEKAALLGGDPDTFFTEPHYDGFPAVLVRLPAITEARLRELLVDAWRCQAPRALAERLPPPARPLSRAPRGLAPPGRGRRPARRPSRRA
jgi:hypothetical protein